jgi:propanediol utilization protein
VKPGDESSKPGNASFRVPVGISGRHIHLSRADLNALFGKWYELIPIRDLSQPGQFVSKETVNVIGPTGAINEIRILGPTRSASVVELMRSDLFKLGYDPEIAAGERFWVKATGPEGVLAMPQAGVISPRHLHATPEDAERYGLSDG